MYMHPCACSWLHTNICMEKRECIQAVKNLEGFILCPIVLQQFCGNLVNTGSHQLYVIYLLDIGRN